MTAKHAISDTVQTMLQNPKIALTVSGGTAATGSATWFDWLPTEIGFYASGIGIIVSLIICYTSVKGAIVRHQLDKCSLELVRLEKEKLLHELEKMRDENGRLE